jgi:hypothetical protein
VTDKIDPPPRPETVLPRWYPDAPAPSDPSEPGRPAARLSSVWSVRRPDGSETTAEFDGPPLAHPRLRAVLQSLFPEPAEPGESPSATPDDRPLLRVTWCESGEPVATASLLVDGRLLVDAGSGPRLDRRLDDTQLRRLLEALTAAL